MKSWVVALGLCLTGTLPAFAEGPSYEANFGMITPGGFILYYNSQGPLSYSTLTLKEVPKGAALLGEVTSRNCQYSLSIPLFTALPQRVTLSGAEGDGGFKKAMANLQRDHPGLDGIFDVKVDVHELIILGIFSRECTEIGARGFKIETEPNPMGH